MNNTWFEPPYSVQALDVCITTQVIVGVGECLAFDARLAAVTVDYSWRALWRGRFEAITISNLEAAANIYLSLAMAAQTG